jgi:N6-L-threonylcarbamoyladenine synthase
MGNHNIKILAIDTSCDETAVAVTQGNKILSNVLWSQASLHSKFGGVYPSLAKRAHEERIDWVVEKALKSAFGSKQTTDYSLQKNITAFAVTVGPGLAIALGVGINKAKELTRKYNKSLIPVNHIEGHVLSVFVTPKNSKLEILNSKQTSNIKSKIPNKTPNSNYESSFTYHRSLFPAMALIASGKHTDLIYVKDIGDYKIIAHTIDDALGEALDKAARMLGLGYPGGPVLEKLAKDGDPNVYSLPVPLAGQKDRMEFSYSGLKTAMYKLVENEKPLTRQKVANLAAAFQSTAFEHVVNLVNSALDKHRETKTFLFGGGVSANSQLRKKIRKICNQHKIKFLVPYSKKLCTDNAAMIGVVAGYKHANGNFIKPENVDKIDRLPRLKIDEVLQI